MKLNDFLPPIAVRIASRFWPGGGKRGSAPGRELLVPFISPSLGSYSQFSEDLLIDLLLGQKGTGFYVDIGANDPEFNNNTRRFYKRGWSGINVEPGRDAFTKLAKQRPGDINLNIGVGSQPGRAVFFEVVGDDTLSSLSEDVARDMARRFKKTVAEHPMEIKTLSELLAEHGSERVIDFLSVDAEGRDLDVLQSNDWERFRPKLVLVEMDRNQEEIDRFLAGQNYKLLFNNFHNGLFMDLNADLPGLGGGDPLSGAMGPPEDQV